MTQPTFAPVPASGVVRPTMKTANPELARTPKAGLQRSARAVGGRGQGTQAPGEGFALNIAAREVAKLTFAHEHDRHDVVIGIALVAAKRASLAARSPQLTDVRCAMEIFGLREGSQLGSAMTHPFVGISHSYVAQRKLVDSVVIDQLFAPTVSQSSL